MTLIDVPPLCASVCVLAKKQNQAWPHSWLFIWSTLSPVIAGQNYTLRSTSVMLHPCSLQVPLFICSELTNSPENIRYWFLHLHKARGLLLRKLGEWKIKYAACLGGLLLVWCSFFFFRLFVSLRLQRRRRKMKREKLNWLALGNMGGISFNFIGYNFNLV